MRKVIITISLLLLTFILGAQEMPLSSYYFYVAVYREDVKWVQKHLEAGYNPNKCRGEAGWYDSKPLKVLIEQLIGKSIFLDCVKTANVFWKEDQEKKVDFYIQN